MWAIFVVICLCFFTSNLNSLWIRVTHLSLIVRGLFYQYALPLIQARIRIASIEMCGLKLFIHSQTSTVANDFISHFIVHVITNPCWDPNAIYAAIGKSCWKPSTHKGLARKANDINADWQVERNSHDWNSVSGKKWTLEQTDFN